VTKFLLAAILMTSVAGLTACESAAVDQNEFASVQDTRPVQARSPYKTDLLIFKGAATAFGGAESLEDIATADGLSHETVGSAQLDAMTVDQLAEYGAIVWPGGYAGQMSASLKTSTRNKIRQAVRERGVGFVGFCAGAFIAVSPDTTWGFALIQQETLPYYHLEDEGTPQAMVTLNFADGSKRNVIWWGGPTLPEFPGGVIARYSDNNEPSIAQAWAGNGLMVLSAGHPEAPADWEAKLGLKDTDGLDHDIALAMIHAALKQQPMPSFK
jgi:hypothetical protein